MSSANSLDRDYLALIRQFPLTPIVDKDHLVRATEMIRGLTTPARLPRLSRGEREYLAVLDSLIGEYSSKHYRGIPDLSGAELLRIIMEEHDLTQDDIAEIAGTFQPQVSAVLSGNRKISKTMALALAKRFSMNVDAFLKV